MEKLLFVCSEATDHFQAAKEFANRRRIEVSWWTMAGDPPETDDAPLPFGLDGQDATYLAVMRNGKFVVLVND